MRDLYDWMFPARRLAGGAVFVLTLILVFVLGGAGGALDEIRSEIIPPAGRETAYGMTLSLDLLPTFIEWSYTLLPSVVNEPRYVEAMNALVAPCCDDNPMYRCCCEADGRACNLVRSGKGLAAYLIAQGEATAGSIEAAVLEWLRFARPDYYLAAELTARGVDPAEYGLTTYGSCYRGMCNLPISEGGCGGMDELIEPAISAPSV